MFFYCVMDSSALVGADELSPGYGEQKAALLYIQTQLYHF
jgi:hypothetical protein